MFSIATILVLSIELITKREYFQSLLYSKTIAYISGATLAVYHLVRVIIFISVNNIDEILRQSIWK